MTITRLTSRPTPRRRWSSCAVGALLVATIAWVSPATLAAQPAPEQALTPDSTVLVPVTPCRLFDSRETPNAGRLDPSSWRVPVAQHCNVPVGARAAALNVVATDTRGGGFITVWPSGSARPTVSTLNYVAGNTVANAAVVQLGADGMLDVYTHGPAQVVVDVTAVFVDAGGPASSGRFVPVTPSRVLDTRTSGQRGSSELLIPLPAGVPTDATAVAVSITAVDAASGGFLTAYPAGTPRPLVSVVNTDTSDRTRASLALVPVTSDGFMLYRHMTTDVVVDFWGWFTGASAELSSHRDVRAAVPGTGVGLPIDVRPDSRRRHDRERRWRRLALLRCCPMSPSPNQWDRVSCRPSLPVPRDRSCRRSTTGGPTQWERSRSPESPAGVWASMARRVCT